MSRWNPRDGEGGNLELNKNIIHFIFEWVYSGKEKYAEK